MDARAVGARPRAFIVIGSLAGLIAAGPAGAQEALKIYISAQIHISAQDLHLRPTSTSPPKIHIFVTLVVWNGAKPCGLGTRLVSFELYRSGLRPLLRFCPTCRF